MIHNSGEQNIISSLNSNLEITTSHKLLRKSLTIGAVSGGNNIITADINT
jgi:hypothetical protein